MQELGKTEKQIADMNFASEKQISHVFNLVRKNAFKRYCMPSAVNINAPLAKSVQTILPDFATQEYINKFNIL